MKYIYYSILLSLVIAGCTTICKIPGVSMLGVPCPSPTATLLPPILS